MVAAIGRYDQHWVLANWLGGRHAGGEGSNPIVVRFGCRTDIAAPAALVFDLSLSIDAHLGSTRRFWGASRCRRHQRPAQPGPAGDLAGAPLWDPLADDQPGQSAPAASVVRRRAGQRT